MAYDVQKYPEYPGSAAISGKMFKLFIAYDGEWRAVGGCRTNSLSISADSISASDKSDNGWGSSVAGTKSWSSSLELVMKTNNPTLDAIEQWVFNDPLQAERPALHFCFVDEVQNRYFSAWAIVGNYEISGDYDDVCLVTAEITGVGPITIGEGFVAKTEGDAVMNPALDYVAP